MAPPLPRFLRAKSPRALFSQACTYTGGPTYTNVTTYYQAAKAVIAGVLVLQGLQKLLVALAQSLQELCWVPCLQYDFFTSGFAWKSMSLYKQIFEVRTQHMKLHTVSDYFPLDYVTPPYVRLTRWAARW
jgi:hypothetical protein